jgi:hypothetical protein
MCAPVFDPGMAPRRRTRLREIRGSSAKGSDGESTEDDDDEYDEETEEGSEIGSEADVQMQDGDGDNNDSGDRGSDMSTE